MKGTRHNIVDGRRRSQRYFPPRYLLRRYELLRMIPVGHTFCEVGAGDLTFSRDLLDRFDHGTAIEMSDDIAMSFAQLPAAHRQRLTVRAGALDEVDVDGGFDCVVSCEVLEHIDDDLGFLTRLHTLLVPGGTIALSVPSRMKYWTVHDEIVGHLRRYERAQLHDRLVAAGFTDIDIRSYGFPWVNLLRLPRLLLARHQAAERASWDQNRRTEESNHRQIPESLSTSPLRFLTRPQLFAPLGAVSRFFNRFDLSDGYVVTARRR